MNIQSLTATAFLAASSLFLGNAIAQTAASSSASKTGEKMSTAVEADAAPPGASKPQTSAKKRPLKLKPPTGEKMSTATEADVAAPGSLKPAKQAPKP